MENRILVVDDDAKIRKLCFLALKKEGYEVTAVKDAQDALNAVDMNSFDLALLDIVMPNVDGLELLHRLKRIHPDLMIIMITGYPQIDTAVKAIKQGAYDYIPKPFSLDEIRIVIKKVLEYKHTLNENLEFKKSHNYRYKSSELIGSSPKMLEIFKLIERVRKIDCTILTEGESGTGKEVLARTIHKYSNRAEKPFIAINCGALPESLLESELFGYEKGAFTGAVTSKRGLFEAANGGTVFLDEISETSPSMQVKLLRIIEEKVSRRIGSTRDIKLDIRLISATNKILRSEVEKGNFREDLYYRLNLIIIPIPPIRERKQDIPLFVRHFLKSNNQKFAKKITGISKEAMELLIMHDFPGNVRELENIVERAAILSEGKIISKSLILESIRKKPPAAVEDDFTLESMEKKQIEKILNATYNNKTKAANLLGIDRKTLYQKIKKYGIFF